MRLIPARAWALVVLSAILQLLAFPMAGPLPVWRSIFCWVCLVPFLWALFLDDRAGKTLTIRQSFYLGYFCGFLWYLGNCYWIYQTMYLYGGLPKPVALLILFLFALYLGLYHALFAVLLGLARRVRAGLLAPLALVPFLWVAIELARARITGFPWDLLGYSQIDNSFLTRLAPIAGVMGISFVVAAVNAAAVLFFLPVSQRASRIPKVAVALAAVMQMLGVNIPITAVGGNRPWAVMMQENLEVGAQGREVKPLSKSEELDSFIDASIHPSWRGGASISIGEGGQAQEIIPSVIVWPEAPSHLRSDDPFFRARMNYLARKTEAPLIIGSLGVDFDSSAPRGYYEYDSASLFDSAGIYRGRYDKVHLVPWGEYVPFKRFFAFAQKLTEGVGDMDRGHERTIFATGGHTYGVFVCYESIFGDEVRQFAKNGAEVLVNISDDGWYGDSGAPWQHLNMARMRAIENHRWVLRSTNTGITTAIDPYGRTDYQAPRHVRGAFAFPFEFEPARDLTIYTRYGDWFAWLCVIVSVVVLAASKTPLLQRKSR